MESEATQERIAELERQLAEAMAAAQAEDRGSEESAQALERIAELSDELGRLLQMNPQSLASAETPRRTRAFGPIVAIVVLAMAALGYGIWAGRDGGTSSTATREAEPAVTTVPHGGQLRVGASLGQKRTVDCNEGNLTLYGTGNFSVTGHCVSLTTGALRSQVSVERADGVNITGSDSEYFIAGHSASLTVTGDDNKVHLDGIDAVNFAGDDNSVSYKSGSPAVADGGQGNVLTEKK